MGGRVDSPVGLLAAERQGHSVTAVGRATVAAQPDRLRPGDLLAARYQIEAELGVGASGRVLRAFDRETRSVVAVKVLKPELAYDAAWVDRLSRELRVARQIQHPNLCRVFDVGEAEGYRFLTMEIASGGTLGQEIRGRAGSSATPARIGEARAILQGVAALHAANIIHRDLKPENILRMADGRLVISDFGLATDPGVGPTSTILVGTPSYMAPEVAMGDLGSPRSDVFSLGIVLHELLFGARPEWRTLENGEREVMVVERPQRLDIDLAELCRQCLRMSPGLRPASAECLLARFDAALGGRDVPSRGRRPASLTWAAGIVLSLCALLVARDRWWSRASASLFPNQASKSSRVLAPGGSAVDWTDRSTPLASFPGHIACYALVDHQRTLRVIWGQPSRAEELDLRTGQRQPAKLLPVTFAEGCPETSPDGRQLLFTQSEDVGTYVFMGLGPDGRDARKIVKGSLPKWLANGEEFVFDLDSRHPAVFSLPTGEMTVLSEGLSGARHLAEKAVDPSGRYMAIRYLDDAADSHIVIESQDTFEPKASFMVPPSALGLGFGRDQKLTFTLYGDHGSAELIEADWRGRGLARLGRISGADIVGALETTAGTIVLSRKINLDVWLDGPDRPVRLTSDGISDGGAMSARGDLLIQRFLGDRRYAIALRDVEGRERLLTQGPMDMSPSFFADSDRWIYASYRTQQIFQCRLSTGACAAIHTDTSTPVWPTADPRGDRVAYETLLNASRLRVVDLRTSLSRDMGPVLNQCPPFWVPGGRLWAMQSLTPRTTWAEFDVGSGLRTGKTVTREPTPDQPCRLPPGLRADAERISPRVFTVADEQAEARRRPSL